LPGKICPERRPWQGTAEISIVPVRAQSGLRSEVSWIRLPERFAGKFVRSLSGRHRSWRVPAMTSRRRTLRPMAQRGPVPMKGSRLGSGFTEIGIGMRMDSCPAGCDGPVRNNAVE
jgi:hypothetical protein